MIKSCSPRRTPLCKSIFVLLAVAVAPLCGPKAYSAAFVWDALTDTPGTQDGSGTWDTTNSNWITGGVNSPWVNGAADTATFGAGTDGTYAIEVALTNGIGTSLNFVNSGYTLSATSPQTVTLSSTTATLSVAAGKTATIGNNVLISSPAANASSAVTGTGTLIIESGGTLRNRGTSSSNILIINGATVQINTGGSIVNFADSAVAPNNGNAVFVNGTVNVNGGTLDVSAHSGAQTGGTLGIGGTSGQPAGTLTLNSGSVLAPSSNGVRFGATSGTTPGGVINLNGGSLTTTRLFKGGTGVTGATLNLNGGTLKAADASFGSTFLTVGGTNGLTAASVKAGGAIIDSNGFSITAGSLTDGGGGGGLTKIGTGTLTLNGVNTYTGTTLVSVGTLSQSAGSLAGSVDVNGAGALFTQAPGATIGGAGGLTISNGSATLGGANTYAGATNVNAGTLTLTGSLTSNIAVAAGATMAGEGTTTGSLTFAAGGESFLSFDPNTPGALTANMVTSSGATVILTPATVPTIGSAVDVLNFSSGGYTGVTSDFQINARGSIALSATKLQFTAEAAANLMWAGADGANPTSWDSGTTANWLNGAAADKFYAGDHVTFDDTASSFTVAVQGPLIAPGSITFANASQSYLLQGAPISGTANLHKSGGGLVTVTSDNTFSGGVTIEAGAGAVRLGDGTSATGSLGTGVITNDGSLVANYGPNNVAVSNTIDGAGTFIKEGDGTVVLSGTNSYFGATVLNAGAVSAAADDNLGAGSLDFNGGSLTVTGTGFTSTAKAINWGVNGGGFNIEAAGNTFTVSQTLAAGGGLRKGGAGTLVLSGTNSYTGATTLNAGTISVADDANLGEATTTLDFDGGTLLVTGTGFTSTSRTINWGENGGGFNVGDATNTFTVSQSLDAGGGLTKSGPGTLVLSGANSYSGVTNLAQGVLRLEHSMALGASTFTTGITQQLQLARDITVDNAIRIASSGLGLDGILKNVNGDNTLTNLSVGGTSGTRIHILDGSSLTIPTNLGLAAGGSAQSLRVLGGGTLALLGDNSAVLGGANSLLLGDGIFPGPAIKAGHDLALGTSTVAFQSNSNSTVQSSDDTARSFANAVTLNSDATFGAASTGDITFNGAGSLGSDATIRINNARTTFSAGLGETAGPRSLIKAGTGTLVLGGSSSYTGDTTVNEGTLLVTGTLSGTSNVGVDSGATLAGLDGTVGSVIVNAGGSLAPGDGASTGTLNTGALSLSNESIFQLKLDALIGDKVASSGVVNLAGTIALDITVQALAADNTTFVIVDSLSGITGVGGGARFEIGGNILEDGEQFAVTTGLLTQEYVIDYDANGGNAITLLAVPEPGTALSLVGGLGVLFGLRRRRRV